MFRSPSYSVVYQNDQVVILEIACATVR